MPPRNWRSNQNQNRFLSSLQNAKHPQHYVQITTSFLLSLPKCEHHIHLEGALTPELVFSLARKNKIALPDLPHYQSPEALAARYDGFDNLDDFLNIYYTNMSVLITEDDFY